MTSVESQLEAELIAKLRGLKYEHRPNVFTASQAEKLATVRMQRGLLPPLKWSSDVEIA